jgi:Cd2+/Zn2+-exporting ATPase
MNHAPSTVQAASTAPVRLSYRVEGMDCPTCVTQVEAAARSLSGVRDLRASHLTQTLEVALDESRTPRTELEARLRTVGHPARLTRSSDASMVPLVEQAPPPWYRTRAGRQALWVGTLLALAFGLSFVVPAGAPWLYGLATLFGVTPLARKAVAGALVGNPFTINTLVSLAAVGALLIGEAAEGAVVVFFFLIGELLEGVAAGRARRGIAALAALAPKIAQLLDGDGVHDVPAAKLQVGQRVRVVPGARVPADGRVVAGQSHLDESPITGESVPRFKDLGADVFAGSINHDGALTVEVTRSGTDNTLTRILHLVEQAETNRAPTARFIDRFSRAYTPGVLLVSLLTMIIPPLLTGAEWGTWIYRGLALLLIGCPCALVLSVPAATTSAISAGARRGLLIKGGVVLETLAHVRTIAFDKTGTLTQGRPVVTDVVPFGMSERTLLERAGAVEAGSAHPLAHAIVRHAKAAGISLPEVHDARALAGKAVEGTVQGQRVVVASPRHAAELVPLSEMHRTQMRALEADGKTVVVIVVDGEAVGFIGLRDEPRQDAQQAVGMLRALGISSVMLTGDNGRTAAAIGRDLGLDVQAELLPEDKHRLITHLGQGRRVAMVGDGINDAPALTRADVGIAMGGGTDVALETAHAALLRPSVLAVVELVQLARAAMGNIRMNIAIALGLKAVFLVTTLLGVTGLWAAILADTGATALVTANALRLLHFKGDTA